MKEEFANILHIGGHADGERLDVKMEGSFLPKSYERADRVYPKIPVMPDGGLQMATEIVVNTPTTHYVLEAIREYNFSHERGRLTYFYVATDVGRNWVEKLAKGYRVPKPCRVCGEMPE